MKSKVRWFPVLGSLALVFCALLSCGLKKSSSASDRLLPMVKGSTDAPVSRDKQGKITIGFSIATDTFIIERWNKDLKIFTGAARELGADVIVQMSAGGIKEQIAQINFLMNQHIDVLVVIAHDTEMIAGAIKQVKDSGIPVVAYDRMIMGVPIDAYISFDNVKVGRLFGEALTKAVPQGKYLVVNGSVRDNNSYLVHNGLFDILTPKIKGGQIQIVQDIWLEQWSFDEALDKIGKVLDTTTDIDAISCGNDQIANAAIQLLSERRLAGKIAVVGQDADLNNCQRVVEGTQLMTVYKPIAKLATRAAQLAVAIATHSAFPYDTLMDNKSGTMIASYIEEPTAVYKWNMDETVIKDGFHSAEDVYRNVLKPVK